MKNIFFILLIIWLNNAVKAQSDPGANGTEPFRKELIYQNLFSNNKEKIVCESSLLDEKAEKRVITPPDDAVWVAEGAGGAVIRKGKLWVYPFPLDNKGRPLKDSPRSHMVVWNTAWFPEDFLLEFVVNHQNSDNGLTIVFFCATGPEGTDIFDLSLPPRKGIFSNYNKGAIINYHDAYWSRNRNADGSYRDERVTNRLRKNPGANLVAQGIPNTDKHADRDYVVRILKFRNHIEVEIDGVKVVVWDDPDAPHGRGRIGFRSMEGIERVSYDEMRVWKIWE